MIDDEIQSMRRPEVRERRRTKFSEPHMAPLVEYVRRLRSETGLEVPEFDPMDGGVNARVLFLFEKPGPMTAVEGSRQKPGSVFISRNNDDPTAAATYTFMQQAQLPREWTITWNVIPGWNGIIKVTGAELRDGVESVRELVSLLSRLEVIVLVGRQAGRAERLLTELGFPVVRSDHPSPHVRRFMPERWVAIPDTWATVHRHLTPL